MAKASSVFLFSDFVQLLVAETGFADSAATGSTVGLDFTVSVVALGFAALASRSAVGLDRRDAAKVLEAVFVFDDRFL